MNHLRRSLLFAGLLAIAASPALSQDAKTIVVNGAGGSLAEITSKVYEKPFEEQTGIKVRATASENHLTNLKAQMLAGKVEWDASELDNDALPVAVKNGWLEPLDYSILDPDNKLPDFAKQKYGVGYASYSTILAIRNDKQPDGKKMSGWKDFWNVKEFPGPRALFNSPKHNLEYALIADGVPVDKVYEVLSGPGGVDRAFAKLDEIKPHIVTWWTSGAQSMQLLADGEVYYTSAWNGRVSALAAEGKPVSIVWNGGGLNVSFFVIPKGAKHVAEALQYIKFAFLDPKRNAEFTKQIPYPGYNPEVFNYLPAEVNKDLPTFPDNLAVQFTFNADWWVEHLDEIQERWNTWILE